MSILKSPKVAIVSLQDTLRDFLWNNNKDGKKKLPLVSRDKVCLPKELGGIGIQSLENQNLALGAKLVMKLYDKPSSLWAHIMFAKYLNNGPREYIFKVSNFPLGFAIWNFLGKCRSVILPHLSCVHNGRKVRFWDEVWNGDTPLVNIRDWSPLITIISSLWGVFVADYFEIVTSGPLKLARWKLIDFLDVDKSMKLDFEKILGDRIVFLSDSEGELIWTKNISSKYIVKDGYNFLMVAKDLSSWPYKLFWHSACLPKAGAFAWLALQDKVLTGMRLDRLGITVVFPCVLCNQTLESSSHLFLHCDYAYECLQWLFEKLNISFVIGKDLISHFRSWPFMFASLFYA